MARTVLFGSLDMRRSPLTSTLCRRAAATALAGLLALAPSAGSAEPAGASTAPGLPADPTLQRLVDESLAARPELRQAEAVARAQRERVPQAGALPDPVLSIGIQNDGFQGIQVGKMPSSYYQFMLSQGIPWPGKRGLRTDVARISADASGVAVSRARLGTEADVRRAYTDLLLARDRLDLLKQLEDLWTTSTGVARSRYEAGEAPQSDVLRAQLELNRLRQRRFALEAQARTAVQSLNRLRSRPVDEPIATDAHLRDANLPALPSEEPAMADALARSPELEEARLGTAQATAALALARRDRYPDLGVSVGVMDRGALDPMWQAAVSIGLPIWSSRKQGRAVAESEARAQASTRGAEATAQLLRLRVAERRAAYAALLDTVRLYRDGLLVQSRATTESTLAQYRVGKVTFASVLEANAGYIADEDGFLGAVADAERIAIAAEEVSLDPVPIPGGGAGGGGMPGAGPSGGMGGGGSSAAAAPRPTDAGGGGGASGGGISSGM